MILYFILFIVLLKISITFYKEGFTSISDIAFNAQKTSTDLSKGFDISKHNFFNKNTQNVSEKLNNEYIKQNDINSYDDFVNGKNFYKEQVYELSDYYTYMYDQNYYDNYATSSEKSSINEKKKSLIDKNNKTNQPSIEIINFGTNYKNLYDNLSKNQNSEIKIKVDEYNKNKIYI
tara:strand:- start:84 stop:611 length:528 start_codon:yes stop_codon:yes gene_type:complete